MTESDAHESMLQERIRERLNFLRRSARDVSLSAGLGAEAVRAILSGRSKSPRGNTLVALAKELACDVSYLLGESETPWPDEELKLEEGGTWHGVIKLEITSWTSWEKHFLPEDSTHAEMPHTLDPVIQTDIASLIDYPPTHQFIDQVKDDHASRLFPPGTYLHCLLVEEDKVLELHDRDLVIAEVGQKIEGGFIFQRTVRQVRTFNPGPLVFETISNNPLINEEFRLRTELHPDGQARLFTHDGSHVAIAALVLRAFQVFAGPRTERELRPYDPTPLIDDEDA